MEEEAVKMEVKNGQEDRTIKEEIFTKVVRAGKRTYFFDVKATRQEDHYLTITESKKRFGKEGKIFYEKHKIFLYKEDFEKFAEGLKDVISFIDNNKHEMIVSSTEPEADDHDHDAEIKNGLTDEEFTNVEFEDLGKK